jgi:hypothetical protein
VDGKERVGCKNRKSTNDDRGIAFAKHRKLKVFDNAPKPEGEFMKTKKPDDLDR